MASAMRKTQKYSTARAGKIRDAAGRIICYASS